jgi:PAS domain-containing protein
VAKWKSMDWRRVVVRYLAAHVLLVGVVGVALLFHSLLVSMPGVVALAEGATVLFAALRFGTGPAIVAALAGVAAWSYLFLPPLFQFKPISLLGDDALLLAALFAASIAVAWLSARAKRLYADLQQENAQRAQLAAIVEFSEDAIIGKDLNGTILTWNRGAERLYGYSADEARGRPISMLAPAGHGGWRAANASRVTKPCGCVKIDNNSTCG